MTLGDVIVIGALGIVVVLIIRNMVRQKKKGACSGCGSCQGCALAGKCAQTKI